MSIAIRVQIAPDSGVLSALAKLALDSADKTSLLDEIGINLSENARLRFSDQVSPDGQPWKPSIRAKVQGGETLRDTGRLMASITHAVGGDSVEYGTNLEYAPFLHFGADIKAVAKPYLTFKIPGGGWARKKNVTLAPRPFLGLSGEDEQQVVDIIGNFLRVKQ